MATILHGRNFFPLLLFFVIHGHYFVPFINFCHSWLPLCFSYSLAPCGCLLGRSRHIVTHKETSFERNRKGTGSHKIKSHCNYFNSTHFYDCRFCLLEATDTNLFILKFDNFSYFKKKFKMRGFFNMEGGYLCCIINNYL
jgi:hypothetical protein